MNIKILAKERLNDGECWGINTESKELCKVNKDSADPSTQINTSIKAIAQCIKFIPTETSIEAANLAFNIRCINDDIRRYNRAIDHDTIKALLNFLYTIATCGCCTLKLKEINTAEEEVEFQQALEKDILDEEKTNHVLKSLEELFIQDNDLFHKLLGNPLVKPEIILNLLRQYADHHHRYSDFNQSLLELFLNKFDSLSNSNIDNFKTFKKLIEDLAQFELIMPLKVDWEKVSEKAQTVLINLIIKDKVVKYSPLWELAKSSPQGKERENELRQLKSKMELEFAPDGIEIQENAGIGYDPDDFDLDN